MADIILHHYPGSPFAEKIRALLGSRKLNWQSVIIPQILPKPDVVALTGGYRKTPIMQLGADIYCDTALIAKKLDELSGEPTLYPEQHRLTAQAIATWGDSILFPIAVVLVFQPAVLQERFATQEEAQAFLADRAALRKNGTQRRISLPEATAVFENCLRDYATQLSDGRPFLLGDSPTIADFGLYHPMWFVRNTKALAGKFYTYPKVVEWIERIAAMGHGEFSKLSSTDAIAIAHDSKPLCTDETVAAEASNIDDIAVGETVEVSPADYGMDPVAGTLALANEVEIVVRRTDERAGEVAVHFPRFCYSVRKL